MRGRSTAAAVLVVAVALAVGATAFVLLLQRDLASTAATAAIARAEDVSARVTEEGATGIDQEIAATTRTGQLVQVLDPAGAVVSASSPRVATRPLTRARAAPGQLVRTTVSQLPLPDEDDPYLLVVAGVPSGRYRVVVATPLAAQQQSVHTTLSLILVGAPLLLLLVGAATWVLVGRTLRPVARIRRRVGEIGGSTVAERIPVPPSDDEVARLAVTMNGMLERLDHAARAQRRFVSDAGHELRSPLSTLAASVELARRDPSSRTWRELSPVIDDEVERMTRLVSGLLTLARADEHELTADTRDVDLDDVVDRELRRLRTLGGLVVEGDVRPSRVAGDLARLRQVVTNLADNAARHAASTVRLTLREQTTPAGRRAVLWVDDDGPGVPGADRERVLERFTRLDDSRTRGSGGTGLGLAIADEVVRAHGGCLRIGQSPTGGCRAEVKLPAA